VDEAPGLVVKGIGAAPIQQTRAAAVFFASSRHI